MNTILVKNKNILNCSKRSFALLVLVLVLMVLVPGVAYSDDDPLIIGLFPRRNLTTTIKIFTPLANYLSRELGREVRLVSSKKFKVFWEGVQKEKYDIVHYNQYHYIKSHKEQGYQVILKNQEGGKSTIAGSLIVRNDSSLTRIQDLKGKKIIFGGGKKAMQSYIVATYLLRNAGLNEGDYVEEFSINPVNAIMAAYFGKASAGGSADKNLYLDAVTSKIDISEMRYLAVGEQLAHLPWAVKKDMDQNLKNKIITLLSELNNNKDGRDILNSASLSGLVKATDKEFDPHRKIVKEVLGEEY